jgi:hypothetical protein
VLRANNFAFHSCVLQLNTNLLNTFQNRVSLVPSPQILILVWKIKQQFLHHSHAPFFFSAYLLQILNFTEENMPTYKLRIQNYRLMVFGLYDQILMSLQNSNFVLYEEWFSTPLTFLRMLLYSIDVNIIICMTLFMWFRLEMYLLWNDVCQLLLLFALWSYLFDEAPLILGDIPAYGVLLVV